jgi:hypothetical protein
MHITTGDAQAWAESSKLTVGITDVDEDLENQVAANVLAQLAVRYDISLWVDADTTPRLVKNVMAMMYVAWLVERTMITDETNSAVARQLMFYAGTTIKSILDGDSVLVEVDPTGLFAATHNEPVFFPTDASTAACPTIYDTADGPEAFQMGKVF